MKADWGTYRAGLVAIGLALTAAVDGGAQGAPPHPVVAEQLAPYRHRLLGVYDEQTGTPVEGADVIDVMLGNSMRTTSTGTVALVFLPDGGGLVRVRKVGYQPQTIMAAITESDTIPITLLLKRIVELPAMSVVDSAPRYMSPALRGFEERRHNAVSGTFIPESVIRKEQDRNLGNFLLGRLAGATILMGHQGQMYLQRSPRCGSGGSPAVYIDGMLRNSPAKTGPTLAFSKKAPPSNPLDTDEVDLTQFALSDLAGIEYYANTATAPSQFNSTSASCGALLLWTRQQ